VNKLVVYGPLLHIK